ncbi:MAG: ATP-binding protein [Gammaproteobacteria bacterium]|nr:ATP-binding protein [Gammaproteobacteria bacterium]
MSDEINALQQALNINPDNAALRGLLCKALVQAGRDNEAYTELSQLPVSHWLSAQEQIVMAALCRRQQAPQVGLKLLLLEQADVWLARAQCYLAANEISEARTWHQRAITANAMLADLPEALELVRALNTPVNTPVATNMGNKTESARPKLRVVANDDTNVTELKRLVEPEHEHVSFADVGGLEDVKQQIRKKIILPFQKPSLFQVFRKRVGGGILLYGPPGCGKTLLARATAGECQAKFFNVAISDILDMYIGESEQKLHAMFEQARRNTPAVIFFDEVEALAGKRQHTREGTSSKLVSQFLSELDGFAQNNSGVLVLAATNVPWALDSAFRRPGRFDRVVFIAPPDQAARESVLRILLAERPVANDIDINFLAKNTSGFSGADLRNVVETAVDEAIQAAIASGQQGVIEMEHLQTALREVKPTTLEWLTTARNYARYANEAGQYDDVLRFLDKHGSR